jgi:hypothetical protein
VLVPKYIKSLERLNIARIIFVGIFVANW